MSGASRGISRGAAGGGLWGRGRGRGGRGKGRGRAGAGAVVSPLDSGSGLGFVEAESSLAGGKHLDRDDYETDGGSSGQKGASENCITTFAGGQQGQEQRDPTSPQLHGSPPQAQPRQRQVCVYKLYIGTAVRSPVKRDTLCTQVYLTYRQEVLSVLPDIARTEP